MRDRIIGPYFFAEKTVTANTYLDMLQLYAVPQLPDGAIFQQDGAPPHFANMVRTFLDEQFPARWIGRGSPYITWPARSPDLTPPDFFLWGFVKDQVYRTPVRDLADLQERIYAAVNNVTPQMLHNTWVEVEYRWIFPVPPMEAMLRFMEHKSWIDEDSGSEEPTDSMAALESDYFHNLWMAHPGISVMACPTIWAKLRWPNLPLADLTLYESLPICFIVRYVQRHTRIRLYKTLARPVLCYGSEAWTLRKKDESRITANEMKFMRYTAGYTKWDHKCNEDVMAELQLKPVINHIKHYQNNWINHIEIESQKSCSTIVQTGRDLSVVQRSAGLKIQL
ncbi:hypothetical protein ANN_25304 [Periplaneta americana]|uniref:Uncharacterized protein n=1 Tax=Periplaneta americana TaxID=6978 RepID=A0ABQ8S1I1_PERAM|nr:hypothetical protein ANN_25304 [Periplaneta americana]